jgi:hypothetical protein
MNKAKFDSGSLYEQVLKQARQNWPDLLIAGILMVLGGLELYHHMLQINPLIIANRQLQDVWFESDIPRVFANLTDRFSDNSRLSVHPLFSLLTFPFATILHVVLRTDLVTTVRLLTAIAAALCLGTLFGLLRLIDCRRLDAALLSVLALVSAAARFWLVVPETYVFGLLTILLALVVVALAQKQVVAPLWYVIVSALTLSMTITNWMIGILATLVQARWQQARRTTTDAFCLVVLLWGLQKMLFPSAAFFLGSREESKRVLLSGAGGFLAISQSFIFHTMVMPAIKILESGYADTPAIMHTQPSLPGSGSVWGLVAVGLWAALLGLGVWALFTLKSQGRFRLFLGSAIAGQYLLHLVYGKETFLYSLHFLPLLIALVALSLLTRMRLVALVLVSALILSAGINNAQQFQKATAFLQRDNLAEFVFQRPCTTKSAAASPDSECSIDRLINSSN